MRNEDRYVDQDAPTGGVRGTQPACHPPHTRSQPAPAADTVDDDAPTGVYVRPAESSERPDRQARRAHATRSPHPDAEMLTVKEAADLLRVNVKTVYLEIAAGRLRHVQLGSRIIRIPRAVIASLLSKSA